MKRPPAQAVRMLVPVVRLRELLARPGGLTRQMAVGRAGAAVEAGREEALSALVATIDEIDAEAQAISAGPLSPSRIKRLLEQLDRIGNIAGTYQLQNLEQAAILFCDLLLAQTGHIRRRPDVLEVFVQTLRLFAINGAASDSDRLQILKQLARIPNHFDDRSGQRLGT